MDTLGGMLELGEGQRNNKLGLQQGHRAHRGWAGHGGRRGRGRGREGHVAQVMIWDSSEQKCWLKAQVRIWSSAALFGLVSDQM